LGDCLELARKSLIGLFFLSFIQIFFSFVVAAAAAAVVISSIFKI